MHAPELFERNYSEMESLSKYLASFMCRDKVETKSCIRASGGCYPTAFFDFSDYRRS